MGARIRGIPQAKANLDKLINDIHGRKVVRAMQSALFIGSSQAALYTPIGDTSTLINSQFREIFINGYLVTGRIGYSADYAIPVHDPMVKQRFRRSTAQKEFLKKGVEETKGQIDVVVKKELSV